MSEADYEPMEKPGEEWFFKGGKMSEKKGSFNSAIGVLQKELRYWPDWRERFDSCQAAIRVLEAAGKVDRVGALKFIHASGYPVFPYPKNMRQIRALIESLPERGKEKK